MSAGGARGERISRTAPETAQTDQTSARTCQALQSTRNRLKTAENDANKIRTHPNALKMQNSLNALKIEPPEFARLWRQVGIGDTDVFIPECASEGPCGRESNVCMQTSLECARGPRAMATTKEMSRARWLVVVTTNEAVMEAVSTTSGNTVNSYRVDGTRNAAGLGESA